MYMHRERSDFVLYVYMYVFMPRLMPAPPPG